MITIHGSVPSCFHPSLFFPCRLAPYYFLHTPLLTHRQAPCLALLSATSPYITPASCLMSRLNLPIIATSSCSLQLLTLVLFPCPQFRPLYISLHLLPIYSPDPVIVLLLLVSSSSAFSAFVVFNVITLYSLSGSNHIPPQTTPSSLHNFRHLSTRSLSFHDVVFSCIVCSGP